MQQHVLRVERPVVEFSPLVAAVRHEGGRVGWLELRPPEAPPQVPADLEAAASLGVLRAVTVGGGRSVAVKPMRGAPVLADLLREHFRGCLLVLVNGPVEAPLLTPQEADWSLVLPGEAASRWTTADLVAALRRPRPWGR